MKNEIVKPDGTILEAPIPGSDDGYMLKQLQDIVGGYIETIVANDGRIIIFDEEGKWKNKKRNRRADAMAGEGVLFPGDYLVGTVMFCNPGDFR